MKIPAGWRCRYFLTFLLVFCVADIAQAQSPASLTTYTNPYEIGVFAEYSPDSSHILLGYARQRKLVGLGASFAWRIVDRDSVELSYLVEVRPLLLERDPTLVSIHSVQYGNLTFTPPVSVVDPSDPYLLYNSTGYDFAEGYTDAKFLQRWTYTGGASPVGFKLNGFTHRRLQPEFTATGGFLIAPHDIPIQDTSAFNFTFQLGAGLQWYRTRSQSIQAEVRYHHLSNGSLGTQNPGVDSVLWKLTYIFGRSRLLR